VSANATAQRTLSELIVNRLTVEGTRALFGVPGGGGNLDLIEAAGAGGLPFVLTATECGGALAAMAQAEVTGDPGACLTTLGPGATSVANGVACAFLDRAALLVFTDTQPAATAGAFAHQQIDHRALFAPITNWSGRLTPTTGPETLARAISAARRPRPGPVHLDCPGEDENAPSPHHSSDVVSDASNASPRLMERILAGSRKPILIVGLGARQPADATAVRALAEHKQLPVLVTYKAKGVVPDDHRCFAGVFTHAAIERSMLEQSDCIIGVGLDPVELLPRPWSYRQPVVYVGRWSVPGTHVPFAAQLVSEIAAGIAALEPHLSVSDWDLDELASSLARQRQAVDIPTHRLSAQRAVTIAAERLAASSRVTVDAGAHMFAATMLWPSWKPNQMLISNGLSTMGFALPAAIGAAALNRAHRVVALTGDGGLLMCAGELLTAAREKLAISVIVFNDQSLSLIEIKQQKKRYRAAGVGLGTTNWCRVADGFGVAAFSASNEAELERALESATAVDGPALIDARIDRSNYSELMRVIRGQGG
jgi:acetolactate synthase-1/2/3 large subunit